MPHAALTPNISIDDIIAWRYDSRVIVSFADNRTRALFQRADRHKGLPNELQRKARQKLVMIHNAARLEDLRVPPGNRLEALKGNRKGQYSIRINDQFRICFVWRNGDAHEVEIADYH